MSKKPIMLGLSIMLLTLSMLTLYVTLYTNVNGIPTLLNQVSQDTEDSHPQETSSPQPTLTTPDPSAEPVPSPVPEETQDYTEISISALGDFLMHDNLLTAHYSSREKSYDFTALFPEIAPILAGSEYTLASLEVPLGGTEAGDYRGFPQFNCPDGLVAAMKSAGVDLLLTAGTHAFDAGSAGLKRTLGTVQTAGLDAIGTRQDSERKPYIVKEIEGIRVGFVNYTAAERNSSGKISLNGTPLSVEQEALINYFEYEKLDAFYSRMQEIIGQMKQEGAEILVTCIRWGTDYTTEPDQNQKAIAQKLSDLGVDLIFGNGPHMVQSFEVLQSKATGRTTLCMYSLGNFVSNQRKELVNHKSGHTEDGVIYKVNLRKYKDGKVEVGTVTYIPTWLSLDTNNQTGQSVYRILPLGNVEENTPAEAKESYKRTNAIIQSDITAYNATFAIDGGTV